MKGKMIMKKLKKLLAIILVGVILASAFACSAFAAAPSVAEMQKSVVLIQSKFKYSSVNYPDISFSMTGTGTGFAIGEPGKPVQYIATCNHCIYEPSGVYGIVLDAKLDVVKFIPQEEGTKYPQSDKDDKYIYIIDYFKVELVDSKVIYSASSGDYTSISVINSDRSSDVAICKLASDPTEKIQARALKLHDDIEVGTNVYAIGYPFTSDYANTEGKYDYKDSTVTKGIVSKSQLTYGIATQERQFFTYLIDASITHGNSGGPLVTEDGYIIGVNSFGYSSSEDVAQANYAIAIDELVKLMDQSSIPYEIAKKTNAGLIVGIVIGGVVVVAAIAGAIVFLLIKKKKINNVAPKQTKSPVNFGSAKNEPFNVVPAKKMPVNNAPKNDYDTRTVAYIDPDATVPVHRAFLVGVSGLFKGDTRKIEDKLIIGRSASKCNVVFPSDNTDVSNVHCSIEKNGKNVVLIDLDSTNGTFLANGKRIAPNEPVTLSGGDRFWVASKENTFEIR